MLFPYPYETKTYKAVTSFLVDFPAWTVIGLGIILLLPKDPGFEETWLKGVYGLWGFSFLGLYWTRHIYVWLWRIFKKVFHITSIY